MKTGIKVNLTPLNYGINPNVLTTLPYDVRIGANKSLYIEVDDHKCKIRDYRQTRVMTPTKVYKLNTDQDSRLAIKILLDHPEFVQDETESEVD